MNTTIKEIISIFDCSLVRYFLIAGIPFALFYRLLKRQTEKMKIQQRRAMQKDFIREILHSLQSTFVFTAIISLILFTKLKKYTLIYDDINTFSIWYLILSVEFSLVIHDTYFYWMHRALHAKKLFKYTHLVHHKSTNPSPWTSYSFHIAEAILEGCVLFIITMSIPMHPIAILLFTVFAFIINVYGHLGYEIMPKGFRQSRLFEIFNTSVYHNMHHSRFKGNYGLYFRIWDRLMGTENPDYVKEYDRIQEKRFGTNCLHDIEERVDKNKKLNISAEQINNRHIL